MLVWGSWTSAKTSQPLTHLRGVSTFCLGLHAGACMWNHKKRGITSLGWSLEVCLLGCCLVTSAVPLEDCQAGHWGLWGETFIWDVLAELCLPGSLASCVLLCDDQSSVAFQKDDSGHTWLKGMKHSLIFFLPHPWNCVTPYVSSWLVRLG